MYLPTKLPEAPPVVPVIDDVGLRLLKAAQIIRERGHCRDGWGETNGSGVCVMHALQLAGVTNYVSLAPEGTAIREEAIRRGFPNIVAFSNGSTAAEVIAALEAAARQP